jgi:hypothetical protein
MECASSEDPRFRSDPVWGGRRLPLGWRRDACPFYGANGLIGRGGMVTRLRGSESSGRPPGQCLARGNAVYRLPECDGWVRTRGTTGPQEHRRTSVGEPQPKELACPQLEATPDRAPMMVLLGLPRSAPSRCIRTHTRPSWPASATAGRPTPRQSGRAADRTPRFGGPGLAATERIDDPERRARPAGSARARSRPGRGQRP